MLARVYTDIQLSNTEAVADITYTPVYFVVELQGDGSQKLITAKPFAETVNIAKLSINNCNDNNCSLGYG